MKNFQFLLILLLISIVSSLFLFSQNDSTLKKNDLQNHESQKILNDKIGAINILNVSDSIQRLELENQLLTLKTSEYIKISELQKQLKELKEKEIKRIEFKKAQIDSLRKTSNPSPVIGLFNDTLYLVYSRLGSFSTKERAEAVSKRISNLAENYLINIDSIKVVESEFTVDLVFDERIIVSVSENDALWNNSTKLELANNYQRIITNHIKKYHTATSFKTILSEIGISALILFFFIVLLYFLRKMFNKISAIIKRQEDKIKGSVKFKKYTFLEAQRQIWFLLKVKTILEWLLYLMIIYIALSILLGIFPWTQHIADQLFGYVLNPIRLITKALWNYFPNLITIIVIVSIFRYVLKFLGFLKNEIEIGKLKISGFYPDWANPTFQILRILLLAFMIVVIFPYMPGSDSSIFRGVTVFIGFLFTFSSSASLSNIIAGLVLTYMRLFKLGDRVKIGDVTGDIIEKSLLVTRIRSIKNEIISIPNSTIMNSSTVNFSSDAQENGLILNTTVTIGYDVPWREMYKALIDAALITDLILKEPKPFVLQTSLDDFYVSYQINAYTNEPNKQIIIYSNLHQNIQDVCNERGIEIMSPHYISARDGNMTTIPSNYHNKNYQPPNFNIRISKND